MRNTELLMLGDYVRIKMDGIKKPEGMVSKTYRNVHHIDDAEVREKLLEFMADDPLVTEDDQFVMIEICDQRRNPKGTIKSMIVNSRAVELIERITLNKLLK